MADNKRLNEIVSEATATNAITHITMEERQDIAYLYEKVTGRKEDPTCNACIIQMCYAIKNYKDGKRSSKKSGNNAE